MQGLRRQGRSYALQLLYQIDMTKGSDESSRARFWAHSHASKKARAFAEELVHSFLAQQERIDGLLGASLEHWKLSRLPAVVRNMLRLAATELVVIGKEPHAVVINEALELTRVFMDEESARFVNSVLEKVRQGPVAPTAPQQEEVFPDETDENPEEKGLSAWPDEEEEEKDGATDVSLG